MFIGILLIDCLLGSGNSLKEKRRHLTSLKSKLRNKFNCAISEIEGQNLWQRSRLVVLGVNSQSENLRSNLEAMVKFMEREPSFQLISYEIKDFSLNHFIK